MHPRLAELTEYLAQQRSAVLTAAARLPVSRWTERAAADRWSVSQILEHLALVERGTAAMLAKRIAGARAAGHASESEEDSVLGTLDRFQVSDRRNRLEVPAIVAPTGALDGDGSKRLLDDSRAALLAAIESGDGVALGEIRHTHPRFGELDLYSWILFIAEHEKRHAPQIAEVAAQLAAAG